MKWLISLSCVLSGLSSYMLMRSEERILVGKPVSFEKDIKPITSTICVKCHNTPGNDFRDYDTAKSKSMLLYQRVWLFKDMPIGIELGYTNRELFKNWYLQEEPK